MWKHNTVSNSSDICLFLLTKVLLCQAEFISSWTSIRLSFFSQNNPKWHSIGHQWRWVWSFLCESIFWSISFTYYCHIICNVALQSCQTWVSWYLKSTTWLIFQQILQANSKEHQSSALLPLCEGNPHGFPSQRDSNAESVSMSWHHHGLKWGHGHLEATPVYLSALMLSPSCWCYLPGLMCTIILPNCHLTPNAWLVVSPFIMNCSCEQELRVLLFNITSTMKCLEISALT